MRTSKLVAFCKLGKPLQLMRNVLGRAVFPEVFKNTKIMMVALILFKNKQHYLSPQKTQDFG